MLITHIITGLNDGGAEAILYRLCLHDATRNTHVIISLMDEGKYGSLLETAGIQVHYLRMPQGKIRFTVFAALLTLLRRLQPDAVQCWMYHANLIGGLVAKFAGIGKVFWGIHHSSFTDSKRTTVLTSRLCALLSSVLPQKIVFCSKNSTVIHKQQGYKSEKFVVIANGYDIVTFSPDSKARQVFRHECGLDDSLFVIGMAARFHPMKDHRNLLAALAFVRKSVKDFHCLLAGTGINQQNAALTKKIEQLELQDKTTLLDRRNDIPAFMNAIDLYICSSSSGEAFPNVLAEAMACRTPCVTTDVGDAALIVGETGWVVPPRNPEALAEAILAAMAEKKNAMAAWQKRKQAARERIAEHFTLQKMIDSYTTIWEASMK